jgi:hypothetical protein
MKHAITDSLKLAMEEMETMDLSPPEVPEDHEIDLTNSDVSVLLQESMMDEISRSQDIHDGLVDLVRVTESLETLTPHHMAYLQIATNMALAGTPYNASSLIPSLESAVNGNVEMESLKSTLKSLLDNIMLMLKQLASKFFEFWSAITSDVNRSMAANKRLAIRAKAASGRTISDPQVELKNERPKLEILGRPITNASALLKGLKEGERQLNFVLKNHTGTVVSCGESLVAAFTQQHETVDDLVKSVNAAAATLDLSALAGLIGAKAYKDIRFSANEVVGGSPLLGNRSIFINTHGNDDVRKRYSTISASTNDSVRPLSETSMASTFTADEVTQICITIGTILESVNNYINVVTPKLVDINKKLNAAMSTLQSNMGSKDLTPEDESKVTAIARYPALYTSWSHRLQDGLCNHLVTVCKASMIVCNNSIALHE